MFRARKRLSRLSFFILLIMMVVGCSTANVTSLGGKNESTLAIPSQGQEKRVELPNTSEINLDSQEGQGRAVAEELDDSTSREIAKEEQIEEWEQQIVELEMKPEVEVSPIIEKPAQAQASPSGQTEHGQDTYQATPVKEPANETKQDSVSIAIVGPQGEDYIILEKKETTWQEGDTVLEVLKRVTRAEGIHLEYRGRNRTAYIEGIDNLYEFDRGPLSGWVYRVNGEFSSQSAGAYVVEAGDFIEWLYTLDLGKDVGGHMQNVQGE